MATPLSTLLSHTLFHRAGTLTASSDTCEPFLGAIQSVLQERDGYEDRGFGPGSLFGDGRGTVSAGAAPSWWNEVSSPPKTERRF
jgi:hypothetical protein